MDVNQPLPLLGGLTPAQFMRRHWQKKPLLVRQAISGFAPLLGRRQLFDLAASDATESRLIVHSAHIATYGERAVDTFYVTDLFGEKLAGDRRLREVEMQLLAAAGEDTAAVAA